MKTSSKHIKLFDRAFTLQLFRVLLPIGVTFAALELLRSLDIITILTGSLFGVERFHSGHTGLLTLFFAFAGYRMARIMRGGEVRLYSCIPLAKRTIWGSGLLAALMWGAAVFLAHIAGYIILWFGIIGSSVRFDVVQPSHYLHFLNLLKAVLSCLAVYGIVNLCTALSGRVISVLLLIFIPVICLGAYYQQLIVMSGSHFEPMQILLPVGVRTRELLDWLFRLVFAGAAMVAAYFAFTRSRAETVGGFCSDVPELVIATMLALNIACSISSSLALRRYNAGGTYDAAFVVLKLILLPLGIGFMIYALYMVCFRRHFKKRLKFLAYYPITVGAFLLMLLASYGLKKLDSTVDISRSEIDCVMLPDAMNVSNHYYDSFYADYNIGNFDAAGKAAGDAGSERYYEFRDPELFRFLELAYADGCLRPALDDDESAPFYELFMEDYTRLVVKLKDGRQFVMGLAAGYTSSDMARQLIMNDEGYLKERTDLARFENGHIASPVGLDRLDGGGSRLMDTLLEEIAGLTAEQRAEVFMLKEGDFDHAYGAVAIASPMNRYMQTVSLTGLTPKSTELFMRLCYENSVRGHEIDRLLTRIKESNGIDEATMLVIDGDGNGFSNFYRDDYTYIDKVLKQKQELLIDILSNAKAPGEADCVMILGDVFVISGESYEENDYFTYYASPERFYLGITSEQAAKLKQVFGLTTPDGSVPETPVEACIGMDAPPSPRREY